MTEREQVEAMLRRAGIPFTVTTEKNGPPTAVMGITLEANSMWPLNGYVGFFSEWWFDADGRLVGIGVWE